MNVTARDETIDALDKGSRLCCLVEIPLVAGDAEWSVHDTSPIPPASEDTPKSFSTVFFPQEQDPGKLLTCANHPFSLNPIPPRPAHAPASRPTRLATRSHHFSLLSRSFASATRLVAPVATSAAMSDVTASAQPANTDKSAEQPVEKPEAATSAEAPEKSLDADVKMVDPALPVREPAALETRKEEAKPGDGTYPLTRHTVAAADNSLSTAEKAEPEAAETAAPRDQDTEMKEAAASAPSTDANAPEPEAAVPATTETAPVTPATGDKNKARRKSGAASEPKGKKLNKKASKRTFHVDAKPGEHYLVKVKGWPAWPAIVCDESMLPQSLLKSRPVTAVRVDGTYREDYADGGKRMTDRTFPVMYLKTNEL